MGRADERLAHEILRHQGIDPYASMETAGQEGGGGDGDGDNPPTSTTASASATGPGDADSSNTGRKRAASGEPDDSGRGDEQARVLPPPAPPGVNMRDAPETSAETASRNKRNLETLRSQAQAQTHRRVQADRRGSKRGTDEAVHPEDPRANNTDDPEIYLVGAYSTRCGCCEQTFESKTYCFNTSGMSNMRSPAKTTAMDWK